MLMATAAHAEARQAARLLELWSRLSSRHIALGSSCACGAGGVTLVLDDFELDIYGYLQDSAERGDVEEVRAFFAASTATEADARPLLHLLETAAAGHLPPGVGAWALPKLERTLSSFAELHGTESGGM